MNTSYAVPKLMPYVLRLWARATSAWLPTPESETRAREEAEMRATASEARATAESQARKHAEAVCAR
jgi:hypothetical protein